MLTHLELVSLAQRVARVVLVQVLLNVCSALPESFFSQTDHV
jgi:hypothetical protein